VASMSFAIVIVIAVLVLGAAVVLTLGGLVVVIWTRVRRLNARIAELESVLRKLDEERSLPREGDGASSTAYRE
jgi:hypothetical protein